MSYQKCPVCDGTGVDTGGVYDFTTGFSFPACTVCRGEKIIDTILGLPPSSTELVWLDLSKTKEENATNCSTPEQEIANAEHDKVVQEEIDREMWYSDTGIQVPNPPSPSSDFYIVKTTTPLPSMKGRTTQFEIEEGED